MPQHPSLHRFRCNEHSPVDLIAKRHKMLPTCNRVGCKSTVCFFPSQQVMFGNLQSSVSWHDSTSQLVSSRQDFKVTVRIAFFSLYSKWQAKDTARRTGWVLSHLHLHLPRAGGIGASGARWCIVFSNTSATSTQNNSVTGTSFSLARGASNLTL
jgi:hypothetical protein